jgi:hypothetical protein
MSHSLLVGAERIGDLAQAVRETAACEDLGLSADDRVVSQLAALLHSYQESQCLMNKARAKRRSRAQRRQITAIRNSAQTAAGRIDALLRDPVLRDSILNVYGQPASEMFWLRGEKSTTHRHGTITDPRYEPVEIVHPDDPFTALLETARRLTHLASVLEELESDESPISAEQQNVKFGKTDLVRAIACVLAPYVAHKTTLADYIGDFLKLIDIDRDRKTILNLLS